MRYPSFIIVILGISVSDDDKILLFLFSEFPEIGLLLSNDPDTDVFVSELDRVEDEIVSVLDAELFELSDSDFDDSKILELELEESSISREPELLLTELTFIDEASTIFYCFNFSILLSEFSFVLIVL